MEISQQHLQSSAPGPRPVYIASFPTPADDTYYFWLYYEALAEQGYHLVNTRGVSLTEAWLVENAGKVDIIHFHWPAYIYSKRDSKEFYRSFRNFVGLLLKAKRLNYQIAWTVHNIFPHERYNMVLEYLTRFCLAQLSDVLFVHFQGARRTVSKMFLRFSNIHEIPHGNFNTVFPNTCTKNEARERLCLAADACVYLIFGPVRSYKGIEDAVEIFQKAASPNDVLLVAGNPSDENISSWLSERAAADQRLTLQLRFVPKEEVQFFFNACDFVLLPYKKIFTSGNLFLAFTFGKPVICPDMGIMSEVVDEKVGIKYQPSQDGSTLAAALQDVKNLDYGKCCDEAFRKAHSYTWEEAAARSIKAFSQFRRK